LNEPSSTSEKRGHPGLGDELRDRLERAGWAHAPFAGGYPEFEAICGMLGRVESVMDIMVDGARSNANRTGRLDLGEVRRPDIYRSDAIGFHSDNPNVGIIGWYCRRQDAGDGRSRLVDGYDVIEGFSRSDLDVLASIGVRWMMRHEGAERMYHEPMVSWAGARPRFYYAPWLVPSSLDAAQRGMLERFETALARCEAERTLEIRLESGEALFIDNRRLLHARQAIGPESERHLVRVRLFDDVERGEPSGSQ
jgi:hypothetical protein